MAEDQVVVGDKVEEPNVQLLCVVALRNKAKKKPKKKIFEPEPPRARWRWDKRWYHRLG